MPITITNCSNNYGPFQFPEKVIPLFLTNALDDKPLPLYEATQNKREWLHVDDHCRAIELVLREGRIGETYNVGSGFEASIEEIADAILDLAGKPRDLKTIVPDRPGHDRRYLLDSTQAAAGARLGAALGVREGPRRHRSLVRRAPRVVGAAQGARAGRRDGLALAPGHAPHRCLAAVTSGCEPSSCSRRSRYGSASSQRSSSASDLPML